MLLNDGLETIGMYCFAESGLEQVSIPGSVKSVHILAFNGSSLTQVRFSGTAEKEAHCECSSGNTK